MVLYNISGCSRLQGIAITDNADEWFPLALCSVASQIMTSKRMEHHSQEVLSSNSCLMAY
jgi:hypothetical protein